MANESDTKINSYTMDKDYNLISVLYHALQGADTSIQYCKDAQGEGNEEIAEFMREVQQQNQRLAQRAKELLFKQKQI